LGVASFDRFCCCDRIRGPFFRSGFTKAGSSFCPRLFICLFNLLPVLCVGRIMHLFVRCPAEGALVGHRLLEPALFFWAIWSSSWLLVSTCKYDAELNFPCLHIPLVSCSMLIVYCLLMFTCGV
jgi:hypothetical protein